MNAKGLAAVLDGMEYPVRISKDLVAKAKAAGLVIVYGSSDDLIEFEGAFRDEAGVNDGGTVRVTKTGLLIPFEELDHDDEKAMRDHFAHEHEGKEIEALWCEEEGYSWTYKTAIPHETFEVMEDGEHYCRGIVFSLAEL